MKRRLYTLDVFTKRAFAGNPLAVVADGDGLPPARMQAIAREMNLSETVFVQRPTNNRALARLRIFTTMRELPFAGHPVIGTWFLLAELGVVPAQEGEVHILQQTGAGILPVAIRFAKGRPEMVKMTQRTARFQRARFSRAELSVTLGLSAADFEPSLPLEFVSTGIPNLMVPLRTRAALKKIRTNIHALHKILGKDASMAYCFALGSATRAYARGMIPWSLQEDPATGSAAGSLGAYLVKHGELKPLRPLSILQGVEMGRPSEIHVEVEKVEDGRLTPFVSGAAVRVFEGILEA
jgi:trans-2,3-dihydro-3-hydroxyanthranilate isomerase